MNLAMANGDQYYGITQIIFHTQVDSQVKY